MNGEMWLALWAVWGTKLMNGEIWLALWPVWGTNLLNGDFPSNSRGPKI